MTESKLICGVDIGGSKIACGMFRHDHGELHAHGKTERIETTNVFGAGPKKANALLSEAVLNLVIRQLSALNRSERPMLRGLGIGCCGIIDQTFGILRYANKLPGVRDLPFSGFLEHRLRQFKALENISVSVENDANAAGLAEALYGSGKGCREVVYLTISTGIGGVLVSNHILQRGATGKAGEFGSLYLGNEVNPADPKHSVWSRLAGGKSVAERVSNLALSGKFSRLAHVARTHPKRLDMRLLAECARSGDAECRSLFEETGKIIGVGISNLIDLYDPDCIVIGGGMIKAFDLWSAPMFASLFLRKPSLPSGIIKTARLGDMVGTMGAAAICAGHHFV